MDEKKDRRWQPQPVGAPRTTPQLRSWQPQPIVSHCATPRLTEWCAAGRGVKMPELKDFPGPSLINTRRRLNPGLKKSSFLDSCSLLILLSTSPNGSFFSSWGWQPQPIVAHYATPRLTELFAAGEDAGKLDTLVINLSAGHLHPH